MKKAYIISMAAAAALMTFSCTKEYNTTEVSVPQVEKTFNVIAPETKTTLVDGLKVRWAEDDKITVIGVTDENVAALHEFTLSSGVGEASGTFSGTIGADETSFYAVYPSSAAINLEDGSHPFSAGKITVKSALPTTVKAVKDGFDPSLALLVASTDGEGNLSFVHGMAYIKFKVAVDDIASIEFNIPSGSGRLGGRPSFNLDGTFAALQSSKRTVTIAPEAGTFEKDGTYYLPITTLQSNLGTIEITFKNTSGGTVVLNTGSAFASVKPQQGHIYNIGCPPVSFAPEILCTDPSKLNNDATGGSFTFTVSNGNVSDVTVTKTTGDWITSFDAATVPGTVTFNCSANTGEERTATFTLSIAGGDNVVVTVTQKAAGGGAKETHNWDFSSFSESEMTTITGLAKDAKATAGQTWDFGDGLTMVTNSSSKWNTQTISEVEYKWVATGGKYGSSQKYFQFTTEHVGTVTVLTVNDGSEHVDTANVSTGTSDLKTVTFTSVAAGTVKLYSKDDNVRIFSIAFEEE